MEDHNDSIDKIEILGKGTASSTIIYLFNPFKKLYRIIKADEVRKRKTVLFGLLAILLSAVSVALVYPCVKYGIKIVVWAFTHHLGAFTYLLGLGNLFVATLGCAVFLLPYYCWLQAISLVVMQLCLNRRFISWLALIVWIPCVVLIFMLSIDTFAYLNGVGTAWFYK